MTSDTSLRVGLRRVTDHSEVAEGNHIAGGRSETGGKRDGQAQRSIRGGRAHGIRQGEAVAPGLRVPGLTAGENPEGGVPGQRGF